MCRPAIAVALLEGHSQTCHGGGPPRRSCADLPSLWPSWRAMYRPAIVVALLEGHEQTYHHCALLGWPCSPSIIVALLEGHAHTVPAIVVALQEGHAQTSH